MAKSSLGEPRVPKPASQGGMKRTAPRPPIKGRNSQSAAGTGGVRTGSIKPPGSGTNGHGAKNRPSVT